MNFKIFLATAILLTGLFMTSCKKDEVDNTAPKITITSPTEGAELERGKAYPVTGTVTDDTELAEIKVGTITITEFDSPKAHTITGIQLTINENQQPGNGNIIVTATDKAGNKATEVVNFTVK